MFKKPQKAPRKYTNTSRPPKVSIPAQATCSAHLLIPPFLPAAPPPNVFIGFKEFLAHPSESFGIMWECFQHSAKYCVVSSKFFGILGKYSCVWKLRIHTIVLKSSTFLGILRTSSRFFDVFRNSSKFSGILRNSSEFFGILRNSSKFFEILRNSSEFFEILRNSSLRFAFLWPVFSWVGLESFGMSLSLLSCGIEILVGQGPGDKANQQPAKRHQVTKRGV